MKKWMALLAGAVMMGGLGVGAKAQAPNGNVTYLNNSDNAIWVTIYRDRDRGTKLQYGCVPGGGGRLTLTISDQTRNSVGWKGGYYDLLEVKASKTSCSDHSNVKTYDSAVTSYAFWTITKSSIGYISISGKN